MSNAAKGTLWTLSAFLLVAVLIVWWMASEFRAAARDLAQQSAQTTGTRLAGALDDVPTGRLVAGDEAARQKVAESLGHAHADAAVPASLVVIDGSGKVVASTDAAHLGLESTRPEDLFAASRAPRVASRFSGPFDLGQHVLQMPVVRDDVLVGYVQLDLNAPAMEGLFEAARRNFLLLGLAGLLAIVAAGMLLRSGRDKPGAVPGGGVSRRSHPAGQEQGSTLNVHTGNPDARPRAGNDDRTARPSAELEAIAELFPAGVLLLGAGAEVRYFNPTARELLGRGDDPDASQVLDEALRAPLAARLADLQRTGAPAGDMEIDCSDGERHRRLRFEIYRIEASPSPGYIALVKDRDLLDALEDDLRTATRFRGLAVLYVGAAHDLRGPLNNMVVNLELLKQTLKNTGAHESQRAETTTRQRKYIETLQQEIYRLNRYVQALLDLTAPAQAQFEDLDLVQTLTELAGLIRAQAKLQHVELDWQLPDSPVTLHCQRVAFTQVLLNLIINALEAMPDGGTLTVRLARDGDAARAEICDTGPGIPDALRGRIFDMHFTTKRGATGIGLHVARSVAREHGGEIKVRARAEGGTCFEVRAPLRSPVAPHPTLDPGGAGTET